MTVSPLDALKGAIGPTKAASLDAAIVDYMVEMLSDVSMTHEDLCDSLAPLLIDTGCAADEGTGPVLLLRFLMAEADVAV